MASKTTTDHDEIREWVEARGGSPAHVKSTGKKGDPGILRIDYEGFSGTDTLEQIDWDDWFAAFDANRLAFIYSPEKKSRFSKLIERTPAKRRAAPAKRTATARRTAPAKRATRPSARPKKKRSSASSSAS